MFTVLKNLSNLLAILGDWYFFQRTYGWGVWGALGLMVVSAVAGGVTDARFSWPGYTWQLLNCCFTSGCVAGWCVYTFTVTYARTSLLKYHLQPWPSPCTSIAVLACATWNDIYMFQGLELTAAIRAVSTAVS
jgi:hypothetical protein